MSTASRQKSHPSPHLLLQQLQGPCTAPLDAAVDYIRLRLDRLLPWYVLAMLPQAVVVLLMIDDIAAGVRGQLALLSIALVVTMLWRWIWLGRLQYGMLVDLQQSHHHKFMPAVPGILWLRLASHFGQTWGSLLIVPGFYSVFLSGFATPLLVENDKQPVARMAEGVRWIHASGKRLFRVTLVMSTLATVGLVAILVSQQTILGLVLPSLLGVDTAELEITAGSWEWMLRVFYALALVLDFFWTVACVFLYFESQSRRTAPDLRTRLQQVIQDAK